jgi:hypothetical protein
VSRGLGDALPAELAAALAADDNEGFTVMLMSVGDDDWPHLSLLSVGEVVAMDARRLRMALWPGSTAVRNLTRSGRGTLGMVVDEASYTVRVEVDARGVLAIADAGRRAVFEARVVESRADVAPYAVIDTGIRFHLTEREPALTRWAATREALRGLDTSGGAAGR